MLEHKKYQIITGVLGSPHRVGQEYLYPSKCCGHHKPKLSINFEKGVFQCWVCGYGGKDLGRLVSRWGLSSHKDAWAQFTGLADGGSLDDLFQEEEKEIQRVELPDEFQTLTGKSSIYDRAPRDYLAKRGLTDEDILKYRIGYCSSGEYKGRLILPSFGIDGYCNFFTSRTYGRDWPPYKNGPGNRDIIFNDLIVDWTKPITLTEGVFDSIVAGDNAVPILGSTLRKDGVLFSKLVAGHSVVYLALDPDADKKSLQIAKDLLEYGIEVYKIEVAPYKDIGEMTKDYFATRKIEAQPITADGFLLTAALRA